MMRSILRTTSFRLWVVAVAFLSVVAGLAQARTIQGQIYLEGRDVPVTGWIIRADAEKIYYSGSQDGRNPRSFPLDNVDYVRFEEPREWSRAESAYAEGDFEEAASIYAEMSSDYSDLKLIVDNYGSLAAFRQLQCLRKLGDYARLGQRSLLLRKESLSERYHPQLGLFVAWGTLADLQDEADVDRLDRLMNDFRGQLLASDQMAQAGYLSGVAHEKKGRNTEALSDYHRAMTFNYGADREMVQKAMEAALNIYAADTQIDDNRPRLEEAHGLASLYALSFGELPAVATRFAEPLPEEVDEDE